MTIGIILHPYGERQPGGLPRIIFGYARALMEAHPENEYVIFLKERPEQRPPLPGNNWTTVVLGTGRFWLNRIKSAPRCDAYLFNTPVLPFLWTPKNSVVIALDYPYKHLPAKSFREWLLRIFIGWYHGLSLRRAAKIIAVSNSTKEETTQFFGIPEKKIEVIYHGYIDFSKISEEPIALPEKFFFFAGTVKERKNVLRSMQAFGQFRENNPDYHFVIGGKSEGAYYERVRAYIRENGLQDAVHFVGHLNEGELAFAYKRAHALVFPSIIEATGFPILEAMSCGTLVITSNIFGPKELGGGGAAVLVDPYKPREIAHAMERVAHDEAYREARIANGYERLELFSWKRAGERTHRLFRALVHNHEGDEETL